RNKNPRGSRRSQVSAVREGLSRSCYLDRWQDELSKHMGRVKMDCRSMMGDLLSFSVVLC
ncbi:unnamed protein product, partial [Amoebophrya sp. A120]